MKSGSSNARPWAAMSRSARISARHTREKCFRTRPMADCTAQAAKVSSLAVSCCRKTALLDRFVSRRWAFEWSPRRPASESRLVDGRLRADPFKSRAIADSAAMARPARLERTTPAFGGQYSIQLSYGRDIASVAGRRERLSHRRRASTEAQERDDSARGRRRVTARAPIISRFPTHSSALAGVARCPNNTALRSKRRSN